MPAHTFHSHGPAMGPAALASPTATSRATKPDFRGGRASVMWLYKRNARWGIGAGGGGGPGWPPRRGGGAGAGPRWGQTGRLGAPGGPGAFPRSYARSSWLNRSHRGG